MWYYKPKNIFLNVYKKILRLFYHFDMLEIMSLKVRLIMILRVFLIFLILTK